MLSTSYSIQNDREFGAAIERAASQVSDLRVAFGLIARDWFKSNKAQFSLKGSGQYQPLSEKYAIRKAKKHGNKPILVATGRLRDSLTNQGTDESIIRITEKSMILGTTVPYGVYHQSDAPRSKIPLRKFFFIGPEAPRSASSEVTGRLERWINILELETARKLAKG